MNTGLLLVAIILAYIMVKRWAAKPAPAKPVKSPDIQTTKSEQTGTSALWPWLIFFGCAAIFGVTVSAAVMATVYAVKLGVRVAHQRAAQRSRLIVDADKQHQQIMSGDDAGIYGNYPPAC